MCGVAGDAVQIDHVKAFSDSKDRARTNSVTQGKEVSRYFNLVLVTKSEFVAVLYFLGLYRWKLRSSVLNKKRPYGW